MWDPSPFKHPASFSSLALPKTLKNSVLRKLDRFKADAEFYRRTGRAYKTSFLLYGPPGTGKSTFIAAVANYMGYSIYDMDLSGVNSNLELRALLTQVSDRAVVVVEDIDTVELPSRVAPKGDGDGPPDRKSRSSAMEQSRLTLGGVLNFADGLRSSCGSERIFIFTTNHPERLDPALVRPGRMDMHIKLSYCNVEVADALVASYLELPDLSKVPADVEVALDEMHAVFEAHMPKATPAEVAFTLDAHRFDGPAAAVQAVTSKLLASLKPKQKVVESS
jgi:chaperone BCS1